MSASDRISQKMAGAAGKTAKRARYIQSNRHRLNNAEICRQLGIGRKPAASSQTAITHVIRRAGAVTLADESDWATTKVVTSQAYLMPTIAWKRENYHFIPWPVKVFIRGKARDRDRWERQARSLATKARAEQRSRERADLARRVAHFRSHEMIFVAIGTELSISATTASTLFTEHNSTSPAADSS